MNFTKIKEYLKPNIAIDAEGAREDELRFSFDIGNDKSWRFLTPSDYKDEKAIAERINTLFDEQNT